MFFLNVVCVLVGIICSVRSDTLAAGVQERGGEKKEERREEAAINQNNRGN